MGNTDTTWNRGWIPLLVKSKQLDLSQVPSRFRNRHHDKTTCKSTYFDNIMTRFILIIKRTNYLIQWFTFSQLLCGKRLTLITGVVIRVTRWVPRVEQELLNFLYHLRWYKWSSCCLIDRFLWSFLQGIVCSFVLFLLAIALSVFLRRTASDNLFGILRPLYCLSFFEERLLTSLVSSSLS